MSGKRTNDPVTSRMVLTLPLILEDPSTYDLQLFEETLLQDGQERPEE